LLSVREVTRPFSPIQMLNDDCLPANTYRIASHLPSFLLDVILNIPHFLISIRNALLPIPPALPQSSPPSVPPSLPTAQTSDSLATAAAEGSDQDQDHEGGHDSSEASSEAEVESGLGEPGCGGSSWVSLKKQEEGPGAHQH
jgi:hypothetical protein